MAAMYCQKCRTLITLDSSLDDLNPAAFKLLTDATSSSLQLQHPPPLQRQDRPVYSQDRKEEHDRVSRDATTPVFRRTVLSNLSHTSRSGLKDNPAMSFVLLTESQLVQPANHVQNDKGTARKQETSTAGNHCSLINEHGSQLSTKIKSTDRLFEILSSRSDIDHPICVECTEMLVEGMQKRLGSATRERDAYVEFLRQANADIPSEAEREQAQQELDRILDLEKKAFAELESLEKEKAELDEQILALDLEAQQLDDEEEAFWRERNAFMTTLAAFQSERDRINAKFDHDAKQLQRLQRTNVYNDTFCIGHDGYFGTINGLRLGKLPNIPVDWTEINAAWGQTCLLLATVAEKLNFTFQGYRPVPMGSTSRIEKIEYPQSASTNDPSHPVKPRITTLELHWSGDMPLGLGFFNRRFDSAMTAFLECLKQLGDHVEHAPARGHTTQGLKMPYDIQKDKIHDMSIRLGAFNSNEESWTKALKYTLTCCKYLLAHASNIDSSNRRGA
ncbi:APG6-domain-containing protein [Patellaria atrata CBS 101060]|uniref:APG6-domain-containing protein n=1 Tax=Patellaria atrata CBS 101060 TaxID=1346257 RepID=A0A9P4S712_9PEZI|nr:APG6-domain-containing protein [Patellaria atrata CBS 101060]